MSSERIVHFCHTGCLLVVIVLCIIFLQSISSTISCLVVSGYLQPSKIETIFQLQEVFRVVCESHACHAHPILAYLFIRAVCCRSSIHPFKSTQSRVVALSSSFATLWRPETRWICKRRRGRFKSSPLYFLLMLLKLHQLIDYLLLRVRCARFVLLQTVLNHKLFLGKAENRTCFAYHLLLTTTSSFGVALHEKFSAISLSQITNAVRT